MKRFPKGGHPSPSTPELDHIAAADGKEAASYPGGQPSGLRRRRLLALPDRLYTIREIAELQQVHPRTVLRSIANGKLQAVRLSPRVVRVTPLAYREFLFHSEGE